MTERPSPTPRAPRAMQFEPRMSGGDTLMWRLESDPALRSTIVSAWILEGAPDMDRLRAKTERATQLIPRLRERVVSDPFGIAPPRWETDPDFDLRFHLRRIRVPEPGTRRQLLDLAEPLAMQAFDKERPLWELHVVEGLEGGRSAVLMKLHHAISDGVGLVRMTECLIEKGPEDTALPPVTTLPEPAEDVDPVQETFDAVGYRTRTGFERAGGALRALGRTAADALRDPTGTAERVRSTTSSIARSLTPQNKPLSPLMTGRSSSVRFEAMSQPLADLKAAGKAAGGTVNDAFLAGVVGGLQRYHAHFNADAKTLRTLMPVNVRTEESQTTAGNYFAPARFEVPMDISDPAARIREMGRLVRKERGEPALGMIQEITGVLGNLPTPVVTGLFGSQQKSTDFTTSNVPGPRRTIWMSGAKVESFLPFGPLSGAAINVTVFSYAGTMYFGINTDPAAVRNPSLLVECLEKGFEEIRALAPPQQVAPVVDAGTIA